MARALMSDPEILLMDEPFGALDPVTRQTLQHMLQNLQQNLKKTILMVTHDMQEAFSLADHITFLSKGKVLQQGPPEIFQQGSQSTEVETFLQGFLL